MDQAHLHLLGRVQMTVELMKILSLQTSKAKNPMPLQINAQRKQTSAVLT
jgi:hypothetical protein